MPLPRTRNTSTSLCVFLLVLILFFSGCAQKPWTKSLGEDEYKQAFSLATEMGTRDNSCKEGLETDLILTYTTPLKKQAFPGYLEFTYPATYKFVTSSPFGQPLFIVVGNQKKYKSINTPQQMYIAGGITSFALRNRLPIHFIKGRWYDWLTGKNLISTDYLTAIHEDKEGRGVWMTFEDNEGAGNISHLLVNPQKKVIMERLLQTRQKKDLATISYDDYANIGGCLQPQHINIAELPYKIEIDLKLSATALSSEPKSYTLTPPKGYLQQYRP